MRIRASGEPAGPDAGTYGGGHLGHQNTRSSCARTIEFYLSAIIRHEDRLHRLTPAMAATGESLVLKLQGEMSDDASEEYDACAWLNEHVPHPEASWGWRDGDFGLWPNEEEDS